MLETMTIRLADGAEWEFVGPEALSAKEPAIQAEWLGLLSAIVESQDDSEHRQGELALGIFLLGIDRDLDPDDFTRLLSFRHGDPRAETLRASFRALAERHVEMVRSRSNDREGLNPPHHFRWPRFGFLRGKSRKLIRC
jgi:hypothetical protein